MREGRREGTKKEGRQGGREREKEKEGEGRERERVRERERMLRLFLVDLLKRTFVACPRADKGKSGHDEWKVAVGRCRRSSRPG